jgi:hypothetical protein
MDPDPGTFEELRRLLALKRYERPPPGYFDRFPCEVIARIREGESATSLAVFQPPVPWLQRFWNALEASTVFQTGFSAAICAVLILGLMRSAVARPPPTLPITKRPARTFHTTGSRPIGLTLVERTAPEPSTAGVLPDRPSTGMFGDLYGLRNPGKASSHLLVYPPARSLGSRIVIEGLGVSLRQPD